MVRSAKLPKLHIVKDLSNNHNFPKGENADEFIYHVGLITAAKAKVEAVKKGLKAVRRAALDSGYHLGDLDEAVSMRDQEPETVQATIMRKARYANWLGMAPQVNQGDLFKSADDGDEIDKWFNEGREDALLGLPPKGDRYDTAVPAGQNRNRGWNSGNERRGEIQEQQLAQLKANATAEKQKSKDKKSSQKSQEGETVQ